MPVVLQIYIKSDDGYDAASSDAVDATLSDNLIDATDDLTIMDGTLSVSTVLTALESGDVTITAFQNLYVDTGAELVSTHANSHTLTLDGLVGYAKRQQLKQQLRLRIL